MLHFTSNHLSARGNILVVLIEMVDFPANVKNGVNKRISDVTIKQFAANEFNVSCKDLILKKAILVHDSHFTIYESEYRGSAVAVKVVAVEETQQISDFIDALVDLTSLASLPHDNISGFYGAGYTLNSEDKLREVTRTLKDLFLRSGVSVVNCQPSFHILHF